MPCRRRWRKSMQKMHMGGYMEDADGIAAGQRFQANKQCDWNALWLCAQVSPKTCGPGRDTENSGKNKCTTTSYQFLAERASSDQSRDCRKTLQNLPALSKTPRAPSKDYTMGKYGGRRMSGMKPIFNDYNEWCACCIVNCFICLNPVSRVQQVENCWKSN
jgi:hypothetical protein